MREKSSRVLTSLSRRSVPVREVEVLALRRRIALVLCERVLHRAEHQRQRRAELVAHVAEKSVLARSSSARSSARLRSSS